MIGKGGMNLGQRQCYLTYLRECKYYDNNVDEILLFSIIGEDIKSCLCTTEMSSIAIMSEWISNRKETQAVRFMIKHITIICTKNQPILTLTECSYDC